MGFIVTETPNLNLLGRDAIVRLGVDIPALMGMAPSMSQGNCNTVKPISDSLKQDMALQQACRRLCEEFPDLFKAELGCLKDFELEVKFKPDAQPVFKKPRLVPFAIQDELNQAYDVGIAKGVWKPVQFNAHGTPVVPIRKPGHSNQSKTKIRVCEDYSVTVNTQLEPHRHPLPIPEDLIRKLGGGYGFTKVDLADAFNQI